MCTGVLGAVVAWGARAVEGQVAILTIATLLSCTPPTGGRLSRLGPRLTSPQAVRHFPPGSRRPPHFQLQVREAQRLWRARAAVWDQGQLSVTRRCRWISLLLFDAGARWVTKAECTIFVMLRWATTHAGMTATHTCARAAVRSRYIMLCRQRANERGTTPRCTIRGGQNCTG